MNDSPPMEPLELPIISGKRIGTMARQIHLNLSEAETQWDTLSCEKILQKAIADKERFLVEHPRQIPYQRKIDRILSKAGTSENRLAVLAVMLECKLNELNRQCRDLAGILNMAIAQG